MPLCSFMWCLREDNCSFKMMSNVWGCDFVMPLSCLFRMHKNILYFHLFSVQSTLFFLHNFSSIIFFYLLFHPPTPPSALAVETPFQLWRTGIVGLFTALDCALSFVWYSWFVANFRAFYGGLELIAAAEEAVTKVQAWCYFGRVR